MWQDAVFLLESVAVRKSDTEEMAWSNPGIRYLLLHAKLSPTSAAQNNTNHLLSHRVPEGKESRNDLVGQFWLRFSDEIVVKMPAKTAVL